MRRAKSISLALGVGTAIAVPVGLYARPANVRENTYAGPVALGGLSRDAARLKIRTWWETQRRTPMELHAVGITKVIPPMTAGELGVTIDDEAMADALPYVDSVAQVGSAMPNNDPPERMDIPVQFRVVGKPDIKLFSWIKANGPKGTPARVSFAKGTITRVHEVAPVAVDMTQVGQATVDALTRQTPVQLPVQEGKKQVPDEELDKITQVVSSYTTKFSAGNRPRSSNIKLAAAFFDGKILMPGQSISYNDTVGRRTIARGFQEAGVYINGRHDTGVGGGICQVSTTFYNAALFANLGIVSRQNHSLPVPYVPLGRDATVDYGNIDLVIKNTMDTPIAISSLWTPGTLTFRVLGQAVPGEEVKIESTGVSAGGARVQTVLDPSLPPGSRRVRESGSSGRSLSTTRVVYRDGIEVKREPLGRSTYSGAPRVIAVGPKASAKPPTPTVPSPTTGA